MLRGLDSRMLPAGWWWAPTGMMKADGSLAPGHRDTAPIGKLGRTVGLGGCGPTTSSIAIGPSRWQRSRDPPATASIVRADATVEQRSTDP